MRNYLTFPNIIFLLILLIGLNLVLLDLNILPISKQVQNYSSPVSTNSDCNGCSDKISQLENTVNTIISKTGISVTPTSSPTPFIQAQTVQVINSAVKEFYVPFGAGNGDYSDWTDVPGLAAYIDSSAYPNTKSVTFEVSLHIPTGNEIVSVRLVNATDGRAIANSELTFNGNQDSVFLTSPSLNLDYGQKLYKVQLKTQLKYNAILDQSRVHITTR